MNKDEAKAFLQKHAMLYKDQYTYDPHRSGKILNNQSLDYCKEAILQYIHGPTDKYALELIQTKLIHHPWAHPATEKSPLNYLPNLPYFYLTKTNAYYAGDYLGNRSGEQPAFTYELYCGNLPTPLAEEVTNMIKVDRSKHALNPHKNTMYATNSRWHITPGEELKVDTQIKDYDNSKINYYPLLHSQSSESNFLTRIKKLWREHTKDGLPIEDRERIKQFLIDFEVARMYRETEVINNFTKPENYFKELYEDWIVD